MSGALPLVSVIVPCYNYGHFIGETITSIQQQQYRHWQCIVVDDGSIDNTAEAVAHFLSDSRIKYVYQENQGLSAARNTGLLHAAGDFCLFLDADDIMPPRVLQLHVEHLRLYPEIDVSYGPARYFADGNSEVLYQSFGLHNRAWMPCISGRAPEIVPALIKRNILPVCSALVRKSCVDKFGSFDPSLRMLEDWEFWLRLSCHNLYFRYLADMDACVHIRVHHNSLSRSAERMAHHLFQLRRHQMESNLNFLKDVKLRESMLEKNRKQLRKDVVRAMQKIGFFSNFVRSIRKEESAELWIRCVIIYVFKLKWIRRLFR